jgi:hypothetical protein
MADHVGNESAVLVHRLGKGVGGFAKKLHDAGTKGTQNFKGDRTGIWTCVIWTCLVCIAVPALVSFVGISSVARGVSRRAKV